MGIKKWGIKVGWVHLKISSERFGVSGPKKPVERRRGVVIKTAVGSCCATKGGVKRGICTSLRIAHIIKSLKREIGYKTRRVVNLRGGRGEEVFLGAGGVGAKNNSGWFLCGAWKNCAS